MSTKTSVRFINLAASQIFFFISPVYYLSDLLFICFFQKSNQDGFSERQFLRVEYVRCNIANQTFIQLQFKFPEQIITCCFLE